MHAKNNTNTNGRWRIWVDRGGTFTDVLGQAPDGRLKAAKVLSVSGKPDSARVKNRRDRAGSDNGEDSVIAGVRQLLKIDRDAQIPFDQIQDLRVGTTVATNALLQRKGAKTVLVTNEGLGDILAIGDQSRPDIFALHIQKTAPLYDQVVTTRLRVNRAGEEISKLDEQRLARALQEAQNQGCTSCAIALIHAWRFGDQEQRIAKMARKAGFASVVTSHEVSPLLRLIPRATTTVVQAYLTSELSCYTAHLKNAFPRVPLTFMKSDGGLVGPKNFAARDALLSGPAGGVVGAVQTARRAGFKKVIGFDMGGTSTDVCHWAGQWEHDNEVQIGGVHVSTPALAIKTVAAGGGSQISFDGGRLTVGPDSAGADPGPACYRKKGPLTITDCNLVLGRIAADYFPSLFGKNNNQTLDEKAAQQGFDKLARQMGQTIEQVASGALTIATENMTAAIKRISIARGHDPKQCVLNAFGGAGGQLAGQVAQALGIKTILLHPYAGVLSALGIGLSQRSALMQAGAQVQLPDDYKKAAQLADDLKEKAVAKLAEDGLVDPGAVQLSVTALLGYGGSETALPVDFGSADQLLARFKKTHQKNFGFTLEDKTVEIKSLRVQAQLHANPPQFQQIKPGQMPEPLDYRPVYFEGNWLKTPFYKRNALPRHARVNGPAILIEPTSTTVIAPGWRGKVGCEGELVLQYHQTLPLREHKQVISTGNNHPLSDGSGRLSGHPRIHGSLSKQSQEKSQPDPVILELTGARFMAIAQQMGEALRHSAQSVNVRERLDYSCAVFGPDGSLIANAPHIPVHLGAMSTTVRALLNARPIKPGEVWVTNDVYNGGTHLPDITVISPVFEKGKDKFNKADKKIGGASESYDSHHKPIFFVASRAHHADVGGITPGSMPADSTNIQQEGVLIPFTRLVAGGEFQEKQIVDILKNGRYPARNVEQNLADLRAQVAANWRGVTSLLQLAEDMGIKQVHGYMNHLADYAANSVRQALKKLPGNGSFKAPLDDGSEMVVAIKNNAEKGTAVFDFTGTSAARPGNFNAPSAVVRAVVLYVLRTLIGQHIPLNDGFLAPIKLIIPKDSMLDPSAPHAVVAGNVEVSQVLTDVLLAAWGKLSASEGTMNNLTFGNDQFQHYETLAGGTGAGPDFDGASAVHIHMTNSRLTDPELLEFRYPLTLENFSIRRGSGGKGKRCGGDGLIRRMVFNEKMTVTILANRRTTDPFGLCGGKAGARGQTKIIGRDGKEQMMNYAASAQLKPGEKIEIKTPGGGGFGRP